MISNPHKGKQTALCSMKQFGQVGFNITTLWQAASERHEHIGKQKY